MICPNKGKIMDVEKRRKKKKDHNAKLISSVRLTRMASGGRGEAKELDK